MAAGELACFEGVVFLVVAIAWIIREANISWSRAGRRIDYEEATSGHAGARVTTARSVERDVIELPGPPCPARVRFFHHILGEGRMRRRRNYTEFQARVSWRGGAMRISTPEWAGGLERFYGGRDLTVGDGEFDRRFVIQADPAELARHLLDDVARDRIRRLDGQGEGPFLFQARPREVLVRVSSRVQEGVQLQRFIDECYALVTRLTGEEQTGVMQIEAVSVSADAECQVCGSKIDADKRVLCRKCRTPHHTDCWAYNDGCSTFACGERRSVRG